MLASVFIRRTCAWLFAAAFVFAPQVIFAQREPRDAPPQLIQMGPKWKNVTELKRFAEGGDAEAAFELAERHMQGDEVPRDYAAARTWFKKAADAGVADAWFRLGKLHHDGLGVPENRAKAFELFTEAARRGVAEAQHNVGAMLVSARGVKRDYVEGLAWLIVAGKSGAESAAEEQVRKRLARRPNDIAKAETRAAELLAALGRPEGAVEPKAKIETRPTTNPPPPSFVRPREAPPKVDIGIPKLQPPKPKIDIDAPKS